MNGMTRVAGMVWGGGGFLLQSYGVLKGDVALGLAGSFFLVAGLAYYIRAKGYHPAWAAWAFVPIMGPILLLLQPPQRGSSREEVLENLLQEEDPRVQPLPLPEPLTLFGGKRLLIAMLPIGIAIMLLSPFLPHQRQRERKENLQAAARSAETATPEDGMAGVSMVRPATAPEDVPPVPDRVEAPSAPPPDTDAVTPSAPPVLPGDPSANFDKLRLGMTYAEVVALAGKNNRVISNSADGVKMVRWEYDDGSSFVGRFRGDALDRTTRLGQPSAPAEVETAQNAPSESGPMIVAQTEPGQEIGPDSDEMQEETLEEGAAEEEAASPETQSPSRVVRANDRAETAPGRAALKKPKLPRFSQSIPKGPHDVHLVNAGDATLAVGVRSGKHGKDYHLPPKARATVYLQNGAYEIFYLSTEAPDAELRNMPLTVSSPIDAIMIRLR